MALEEDPYVDMQWPPPHWGVDAAPPAEQVAALEYPIVSSTIDPKVVVAPQPTPPPQKLGPDGKPVADELPAEKKPTEAEDLAAIDAKIDESLKTDQPTAGQAPAAAPEPAAQEMPSLVPPPMGNQEAMFGVPAAPGTAGAAPVPEIPPPDAISNAEGLAAPGALTPEQADEQQSIDLALHPDELAKANVEADLAAKREYVRQQVALNDQQDREAIANHTAHVAAMEKTRQESAQIDADAQKIANAPIDNKLHAGVLGTIGYIVAGALGGAFSSTTGGRNLPLEALNKKIDENWEAQKANREQQWRALGIRRESLATRADQEAADYRDKEAFRLGTYQRTLNALQTKMQDFDPRGTRVRMLGDAYANVAGAAAQAKANLDKVLFDQNMKVIGAYQKQQEINETRRKDLAEEAAKAAKAGGVGAGGAAVPVFGTIYKSMNDIPPKHQETAFALPNGGFAVANNKQNAEDAEHLGKSYKQINYDLNQLQSIALQRKGAKSAGGQIWKKWEDTQEQHYDQLATDFLQQYALILHGRSPTKGVIEEVVSHGNVGLKGALERGDVNELLGNFHDDIQNRTLEQLKGYTGNENLQLPSERPRINEENVNTRSAWMTSEPVKGETGYARFDIGNFAQGLNANLAEYAQNPGLGGNEALGKQYDEIATAQRKAAATIRESVAALQAKKSPSATDRAQLANDRLALKDREEAVRTVEELRKKNVEELKQREVKAARPVTIESTGAGNAFSGGYGAGGY